MIRAIWRFTSYRLTTGDSYGRAGHIGQALMAARRVLPDAIDRRPP